MNMLEEDGILILDSPDSEEAEYIPRDGGLPRDIRVTAVDRNPLNPIQEIHSGQIINARLTMWCSQTLERGILATEIDTGGDAIRIAPVPGGCPERFMIAAVLVQDRGMVQLAVR